MNTGKFNNYFFIYLSLLLLFGIFFLYIKYPIGNDSTIAEWLINYQGGFTRRGIIGEICFHIASFFNLKLRFVIFLFQSLTYAIYLVLIYRFFKNYVKNKFIIFVIFTPIFLLYPVAEIEVLARKELFLFIFFIILLNLTSNNFPKKFANLYTLFIFPIVCLIYEEVIIFAPFILSALVIKNKSENLFSILKVSSLFIPSIILIFYFLTFPLSKHGHYLMTESLIQNFGESCYMGCDLLITNDIDFSNIKGMLSHIWVYPPLNTIEYVVRYILIFLIGFLPLHFLSYYSNFKKKYYLIFSFSKPISLLFVLYIPVLLLFTFGADWGRWINITCTFATLFYFYLYKNNIIDIDFDKISKKLIFFENKKKIFIFVFIIFAFGWSPQTVFKGDVSSFPGYRIPYKAIKFLNYKIKN